MCIAADGNQLSRMLRESDTSTTPNTPAQTLKTVLDFHSKNADITEACCGVMTVLARGLDAAARRHLLSLDLLPTVVAAVHTNFKRAAPIVACIHLLMALSDCGEYFLQHPPTIRVVVQLLWYAHPPSRSPSFPFPMDACHRPTGPKNAVGDREQGWTQCSAYGKGGGGMGMRAKKSLCT